MNKYNNSKIYKIYSQLGNNIYIGSTSRSIVGRFNEHIKNYQYYKLDNSKTYTSSFRLFEQYGINNCCVVILEKVNVETRSELLQIEAKHIKENKDLCVNLILPYTSEEDKIQNRKEYKEPPDVIQHLKEYNQRPEVIQNRIDHSQTPEYKENRKAYRETSEYVAHRKEYRDTPDQKQKRRDYNQQRFNCPCGHKDTKNTPRAIKKHYELNTRHLKYMLLLNPQPIINNITINIETVNTLNTNPVFKTEAEELEELERDFELATK
jgi:hypothetical protein